MFFYLSKLKINQTKPPTVSETGVDNVNIVNSEKVKKVMVELYPEYERVPKCPI